MLVLSRKTGEGMTLSLDAGEVKIVVIKIDRRHVKLGIAAPETVTILRDELIGRENRAESVC